MMQVGDLVVYVGTVPHFLGIVVKKAGHEMVLIYFSNGCWKDKSVWCRGYDYSQLKIISEKNLTDFI